MITTKEIGKQIDLINRHQLSMSEVIDVLKDCIDTISELDEEIGDLKDQVSNLEQL